MTLPFMITFMTFFFGGGQKTCCPPPSEALGGMAGLPPPLDPPVDVWTRTNYLDGRQPLHSYTLISSYSSGTHRALAVSYPVTQSLSLQPPSALPCRGSQSAVHQSASHSARSLKSVVLKYIILYQHAAVTTLPVISPLFNNILSYSYRLYCSGFAVAVLLLWPLLAPATPTTPFSIDFGQRFITIQRQIRRFVIEKIRH